MNGLFAGLGMLGAAILAETDADRIAYLIDDLAKVRGRVLRRLKSDKSLLQDALDAARRQKYYVTIDHIERVIDSLDIEIKKLETGI
jgi:hypothetical protein